MARYGRVVERGVKTMASFFSNRAQIYESAQLNRAIRGGSYARGCAHFHFPKSEPLMLEHSNFRDVVLDNNYEIFSLEEGVKTLKFVEVIRQSSKNLEAVQQ